LVRDIEDAGGLRGSGESAGDLQRGRSECEGCVELHRLETPFADDVVQAADDLPALSRGQAGLEADVTRAARDAG
jgi:hypothetical protein